MSYAGYVITGWVATFVILGAYTGWIARRTRRARRSFPSGTPEQPR